MDLKTINYIHGVLIEKEAVAKKAWQMSKQAAIEADDAQADNRESLWDLNNEMRESWYEAAAALALFESHEW
jgi:hypothetical protein